MSLPEGDSRQATVTQEDFFGIPLPGTWRQDIYSGVARLAGRIWANRFRPTAGESDTVFVFVHPTSNFMGHYALRPLAERGFDTVGIAGRYAGNDSALIVENCVVDLGAVVRYMRDEEGYRRVVLVGNSGGGALISLYQSQAERPSITATPTGDPPDLTQADLPQADGLLLFMAHPSRASVLTDWLDPSIIDEAEPFNRDPTLDMFDPSNGPPYSSDFLTRYREAQVDRNERITRWAKTRLAELADRGQGTDDLPFVVHGTCADPRFLDLSIDPSDRATGTPWGDPHRANLAPHTLGHHTSLRSWISQWSIADSQLNTREHLPRVSAPILVVHGTADQAVLPNHYEEITRALPDHGATHVVNRAEHYFADQPDLLDEACTAIVDWVGSLQSGVPSRD